MIHKIENDEDEMHVKFMYKWYALFQN